MARGHVWTVRQIEALLALEPEPETRALLAEMRDQHLENLEACNRRAEELEEPPGPPYRGLGFARLCEAHDRIYYGGWRSSAASLLDCRRAYRQIERFLAAVAQECERSHSSSGKRAIKKAEEAFARVDPDVTTADGVVALDNALSYAHHALNALQRKYRMPRHDPGSFQKYYDQVDTPFREEL
jgi:hypothetical protein